MKIGFALLALLAASGLPASPAGAQVYKWVDDRGVTHYGERPPADESAAPNRLDIRTIGNDPPASATAGCYTIQCQYERMRDDRMLRDAEWRKDVEARARAAAILEAAKTQPAETGSPVWVVGRPLVPVRSPGIAHPRLLPRATPEAAEGHVSGVRLRGRR